MSESKSSRLPPLARSLLGSLLPHAEREEVLADLADEYLDRGGDGSVGARFWLWRQVGGSVPALVRRTWWRGWSGFEPRANTRNPGGPMLESWIMDLRYAARRLRTRPTYALLAVLTLALGIGGSAAIFGIVKGLLIEPLPYASSERLVRFWNPGDWSDAELTLLRPEIAGFEAFAAYHPAEVTLAREGEQPRVVPAVRSSYELFDVLGTPPMLGRGFAPADEQSGAERVVIISNGLWRELGGTSAVIGQPIFIDGHERTVVGIMPRGFWFPDPAVRLWLPLELNPQSRSGWHVMVARQAPGMTPGATSTALTRITEALGEQFEYPPTYDKTRDAALTPISEHLLGRVRTPLVATMAAMGVILLIACANVAALMLGQVEGRTVELSVRSALGADRRRLTQQLLAEALVLGLAACAVGALLAALGFGYLVRSLPLGALGETATLDWTVFGVALLIAIAAALAIAMVPLSSLRRGHVQGALTSSRTGGVRGRGGMESGLVVAEVALAVLLTAGAALLIRSVANLSAIDAGVETEGIAIVDAVVPRRVPPVQRGPIVNEMVAQLEALPGVRSVAATQKLPLRGRGWSFGVLIEGKEPPGTAEFVRIVTPDWFRTMGIDVRRGRGFERADASGGERLVVINEAFATRYFDAGEDPIGRRIGGTLPNQWERIIGVVANVAEADLTDERLPARYLLYEHYPHVTQGVAFALRMQPGRDAAAIFDAARNTIARVNADVGIQRTTTMDAVFTQAVGPARQVMQLLTILTALALVLGAIGIYGVTSQFVNRRRREWGIRIALGLTGAMVVRQVVARGGMMVALGVVIGLVAAFATVRLLASFLYGVGALDPIALTAAATALLLVGLLAAYIPARRASRVDPAVVLREQ